MSASETDFFHFLNFMTEPLSMGLDHHLMHFQQRDRVRAPGLQCSQVQPLCDGIIWARMQGLQPDALRELREGCLQPRDVLEAARQECTSESILAWLGLAVSSAWFHKFR